MISSLIIVTTENARLFSPLEETVLERLEMTALGSSCWSGLVID
jgi:hypothetical protein